MFEGYNDVVIFLVWNLIDYVIFGSGGYDCWIIFWDISFIGDE